MNLKIGSGKSEILLYYNSVYIMSSDSKAIFEAIQYARGEKGMPEKGDPMYWDDAIGRVRFRSVKIIIDCPSNWMNWRIFLVHL